ncbi:hypothetical protein AB0F18_21385 [Streptomyces sp. NPDC029216]|uniref:hypothetical protein n=1 Tax=Streptomyces sp. NPDC029216 TaxID=3154701 RepID=UPI0033C520E1
MPLIADCSITARPDRGIIEVYDSDAYIGDDEALTESRSQVVAGNGYHLYLHSLQPDIPVQINIRIWDAPQPPPADAEGATTVTLEAETGLLVVNQLTYGPAGDMTLPRSGVYGGYATWTGRQDTAAYHEAMIRRAVQEQWGPDQIGASWEQCSSTEQYTLDLWFVRESELDDEDD